MFTQLFPYRLHLHILQLCEYSPRKFLHWVVSHYFTRTIENKKLLVWTAKAKAIYYLAIFLAVFVLLILTVSFTIPGFLLGILLATQPYLFLLAAFYFLLPLEIYKKNKIKSATERKLASFPNLKIIGITGSYGKTSVKEFLYQIIKTEYRVLRTPGSYNTPYGIAKVVDLELDDTYEYFVCEMGAYRIGDIKEICAMVHPHYGILTGINEQHIETFGSLENTTQGKFELIDALPEVGFGVINIDNERILDEYRRRIRNQKSEFTKNTKSIIHDFDCIIPYGLTDEKFSLKNIKQTPNGSTFDVILNRKAHSAQTKLLGKPNLQNILAAATMSFLLGMRPESIIEAIKNLQPVPHRLEIRETQNMTIIDDAYNSNVDGFKEAIELVKTFRNRPAVFVTPGIVDLGDKTLSIHKELGLLLTDLDYVILVGQSERTKGLKAGMNKKQNIIEVKTIKEAWEKINKIHLDHPVILLENDLPDNY